MTDHLKILKYVAVALIAFTAAVFYGFNLKQCPGMIGKQVYPEGVTLKTEKVFKNRYFLLSYRVSNGNFGETGFVTKDGTYPNRLDLVNYIAPGRGVGITFITELSETDYKQYFKK